jgi:hypothetical protein
MFRVRPELAIAIRRTALDRGLSVQSLILLALRDTGIPVLDADLEDLRGRASGKQQGAAPLRSYPSTVGRAAAASLQPGTVDDVLVERLAALLARATAPSPSQQVTITNCCCRPGPESTPPAIQNPKTRRNR